MYAAARRDLLPSSPNKREWGTEKVHNWHNAINAYTDWMAASGFSNGKIKLKVSYLLRLAAFVGPGVTPWDVSLDDLIGFVSGPAWAPETRKSARSAIGSFYRWAVNTGRATINPAKDLPTVKPPPAPPRPAPEYVVLGALATAKQQDRVMILLAATAGLRRAEIAELHTKDRVLDALRIKGKGGRIRIVPIGPELVEELKRIETEQGDGFYFPGYYRGHISPNWVGKRLTRILGAGWTAHTLRHRFATKAYAAERDLLAVQQLLGHTRPETTSRYTAVADESLRRAVRAATL